MFVGHFGVGLGAKTVAPRVPLGSLFLAAQFVDLLWPTLLLLGVETVEVHPGDTVFTPLRFVSYPVSHALLSVAGWGVLVGVFYYAIRRYRRGAAVLAAVVLSHWPLDFLTHRPDLQLVPWLPQRVGLGLWSSVPATLLVELALFATGLVLYARATRASERIGSIGLWTLTGFLLIVYASNLLGPPPPSPEAVAWVGQAQWLLVAWGYWVDRHRHPLTEVADTAR